jgi:hypothetical protein
LNFDNPKDIWKSCIGFLGNHENTIVKIILNIVNLDENEMMQLNFPIKNRIFAILNLKLKNN